MDINGCDYLQQVFKEFPLSYAQALFHQYLGFDMSSS